MLFIKNQCMKEHLQMEVKLCAHTIVYAEHLN